MKKNQKKFKKNKGTKKQLENIITEGIKNIVISILMISFNLLGNGLRDAFNTSLRGSED